MSIEPLHGPNPFEPKASLDGCSQCKSVNSFVLVCDEQGCKKQVSCGTPTPEGYRNTCGEHWPDRMKK